MSIEGGVAKIKSGMLRGQKVLSYTVVELRMNLYTHIFVWSAHNHQGNEILQSKGLLSLACELMAQKVKPSVWSLLQERRWCLEKERVGMMTQMMDPYGHQ